MKTEIILNQSNYSANIGLSNSIFIISQDILLANNITIGSNSILKFQGGSFLFSSPINLGEIIGDNTIIDAPIAYPIFKNCKLSGTFNNPVIYADWFENTGNVIDDAVKINMALQSSNGSIVELSNRDYRLYSPIVMNKDLLKLKSIGNLLLMIPTFAIEIRANNVIVDVSHIKAVVNKPQAPVKDFDKSDFFGSAIKITGNAYNCTITVDKIENVNKGFDLSPASNLPANYDLTYAGVQYCKFYFQNIIALKCIYVDFVTKPNSITGDVWVNECQFFGGRVEGDYGIYYERPDNYDSINDIWNHYCQSNGMVFNCIGFENINHAISIYYSYYSSFNDLRMSESIYDTYIDMYDCRNLRFSIKSNIISSNNILAQKCSNIEMKGSFDAKGRNITKLVVANRNREIGGENINLSNDSYLLASSDLQTYGASGVDITYNNLNPVPSAGINFMDLFKKVSSTNNFLLMNNFAIIRMGDNYSLTINLEDSIFYMNPMFFLYFQNSDGLCSIVFKKNGTVVGSISESGTYCITFDNDHSFLIIKT